MLLRTKNLEFWKDGEFQDHIYIQKEIDESEAKGPVTDDFLDETARYLIATYPDWRVLGFMLIVLDGYLKTEGVTYRFIE